MKLQRSTWILLVVAIALGSGVLIYETYKAQEGDVAEQESTGEPVFAFEEQDVQQLTLEREDTTLAFEKDEQGNWLMTEPEQEPAQAAAIAFLLNLLTTDPALQTLSATPEQLEEFGLEDPTATITLTLADESTHILKVGTTDFSGDSLYVTTQADTTENSGEPTEETTVYVVSGGLTNGIERPVEEWLEPSEADIPEASTPGDSSEAPTPEAEAPAPEASSDESLTPESPTPEASPDKASPDEASPDESSDNQSDESQHWFAQVIPVQPSARVEYYIDRVDIILGILQRSIRQ